MTSTTSPHFVIRRGQILLIEFDPVRGSEQGKVWPALVVSNNTANDAATRSGRGVVTVLPITANVRIVHPFQVALHGAGTGLSQPSKAQAEQVRSVSLSRVVRHLGWVGAESMAAVDDALRTHLSL